MMPHHLEELNWTDIKTAVTIIHNGTVNRMDGVFWTVYRVGNIIRIDLKEKP